MLPYTPNNASATLTGTIGLTPEILGAVRERIAEQAIATEFRNVVMMGDHGGSQPNAYRDVAKKLDEKYRAQGIHVFYCDEVYSRQAEDFAKWLEDNGYLVSSHGGIPDTSLMMYLSDGTWVRADMVKDALGDPVLPRGQPRDPNVSRLSNGITGDARRSSAEIGKRIFEQKVAYAVRQIRTFIPGQ